MPVFNHSGSIFVKKKSNWNVIKALDLTNSLQEEIGEERHVKRHHRNTTSKIQNVRNDSGKKTWLFSTISCKRVKGGEYRLRYETHQLQCMDLSLNE